MATHRVRVQRLTRLYSTPVEDPWGQEVEALATSPGRASAMLRLQRRRSEELSCNVLYIEPDGSCVHHGLPLYVNRTGRCFASPRTSEDGGDDMEPREDDSEEKEAHRRALNEVHAELRSGSQGAREDPEDEQPDMASNVNSTSMPVGPVPVTA